MGKEFFFRSYHILAKIFALGRGFSDILGSLLIMRGFSALLTFKDLSSEETEVHDWLVEVFLHV